MKNKQSSTLIIRTKIKLVEKDIHHLNAICMNCTGQHYPNIECDSLDCPVFFERMKARNNYEMLQPLEAIVNKWT